MYPDMVKALGQGFGHHDHARATTKWPIINTPVTSFGKITRVRELHGNQPRLERPSRDAASEERAKKLREKSKDVKPHGSISIVFLPVHVDESTGQIDRIHVGRHKRNHAMQDFAIQLVLQHQNRLCRRSQQIHNFA